MPGDTLPQFEDTWASVESEGVDSAIYKRVSLGSGPKHKSPAGYLRLDSNPNVEPDICHDLHSYPWPFEDDSVHEWHLSHLIEHIAGEDQCKFWNELFRCSANQARIWLWAPHWAHEDAHADPTHKFFVTLKFFHYLSVPGRLLMEVDHYTDFKMDFELVSFKNEVEESPWQCMSDEVRSWHAQHNINVVKQVAVILKAHKPARKKEDLLVKAVP